MHKTLLTDHTSATLRGKRRRTRWMVVARTAYVVLASTAIFLFVFSLPTYYTQMQIICPTLPGCSFTGQLSRGTLPWFESVHLSVSAYAFSLLALATIHALLSVIIGSVIVWRLWGKSNEWFGLLTSFVLILWGTITNASGSFKDFSAATPLFLQIVGTLGFVLFWPALGVVLVTFPTGRFAPRWTWIVILLWIVQIPLYSLFEHGGSPLLFAGLRLLYWGSSFAVLYWRYWHLYSHAQRQQTKWLLYGFVPSYLIFLLYGALQSIPALNTSNSLYLVVSPLLLLLVHLIVPLAVSIALLHYRLWDIDLLINRTLVYALLTASTLGLYVLIVFGASALLHAQNDPFLSLLATALIAVLFQPLRHWLQQRVNRVMFGERNEPYRVLARLGQRLEETLPAENVLPTIVETVAHALKLPYVAIAWKREQIQLGAESPLPVAAFGTSGGSAADTRVPLIHQGKHLGDLVLSPRGRGEELTPADLRLVRDLAPQIGMALHSALLLRNLQQLTVDLQRSRERLVTAREEERRRLRRDLHDGLGPQLSSQTLTLSAIKKLLRQDPETAERLVTDAITHAQEAIADIRRLVYALRPPALDDLGLLAALQEQMTQYHASGIQLQLEALEALPPLPAATEIACYRIVQEALTNVVRHAHATHATVGLYLRQEALEVEVRDDGQGLPPEVRSGVGLTSMRERAEELGGTCQVEAIAEGGTRVCAQLPLEGGQPKENETAQKGERGR